MVDAALVGRVADDCCEFLRAHIAEPWSVPVPDLDMTVAEVVAHAAEGCLWYAIDLAAGGVDVQPVEHRVRPDVDASALIDTLLTYAGVVAAVVRVSPATARGFHPMGTADPSGFAAMACDEMLIHTDDAARGLGHVFEPSADVVAPVVRRLFPWIDDSDDVGDPWNQLRWANGRIALDRHARVSGWAWHCAPLDEWDGTVAVRSGRPPDEG